MCIFVLGGSNAPDSLKLAKEKFCSISFADLTEDDFLYSREAETSRNTLFKKSVKQTLGNCDAFISHSWSDDGTQKFAALERWASNFKDTHGYHPQVWIDKVCVNQTDISSDLLCLPIFTAGCQTLLILAGPTYPERLWCIIEIFAFLKVQIYKKMF